MEKVLKDIQEAETQADEILDAAQKEAARVISKAKKDAYNDLQKKKQEVDRKYEEKLLKEKQAMEGTWAQKESDTRKKIHEMQEKSKKHMEKVEEYILRKFEEKVKC